MRRLTVPAVLVMAALSLAGCSSIGSDTSVAPDPAIGSDKGSEVMAPGYDAGSGSTGTASDVVDRQVVTTGQLRLSVDDPVEAADAVTGIVERAGGGVDSRKQQTPSPGSVASAWLTVRIPAAQLSRTLDEIEGLGEVQETSISSADVTARSQDLDARITALRTSVDRLLDLMGKTGSVSDLMAVETALSQRQADLESLEAQQRVLADQVALATVTISLIPTGEAVAAAPESFWSGLATGWNALVGFFAGALVVIGIALPWLIPIGVLAAVAIIAIRLGGRRRPAAALPDELDQ